MAIFRRSKNTTKPVLSQILDLIPSGLLEKSIQIHQSDRGCSKYKAYDQLVSMTFGQLNKCYTLSDISCGLSISETFLTDIGLSQNPAKSTMSDGNSKRNYKVYATLYNDLLKYYATLFTKNHQGHIIKEIEDKNIKLQDSTLVSLCLKLFDWAKYRTAKGGLKIHTVWDDQLGLPEFINITEAQIHDRHGFSKNTFKKDTIIVEDRGYFDFGLMLSRINAENTFVTRIKSNTLYQSIEELDLPDTEDQDILKDEIIQLTSNQAKKVTIDQHKLRLVHVYKEDQNKVIEIITNNLTWSARTIADLYKKRWDIELFFKSIKQNLQIKTFLGTSENAVKSQIYIALITNLLLQLIKRINCNKNTAFSNFCEKIRICLVHYLTIQYVCNELKPIVQKREKPPAQKELFNEDNSIKQMTLAL